MRHYYHRAEAKALGSEGMGLSVISPSGGDYGFGFRMRAAEPIHKDNPATDLESPDWHVIFMLDPNFASGLCIQ